MACFSDGMKYFIALMTWVWLGAVEDGLLTSHFDRRSGAKHKLAWRLPAATTWLRDRLRHHGGDVKTLAAESIGEKRTYCFTDHPPNTPVVRAVAQLSAHGCSHHSGILTEWSGEMVVLRKFFGLPLDCYSMRLEKVFRLSPAKAVLQRRVVREHGNSTRNRTALVKGGSTPFFLPVSSELDPATSQLADGQSVASMLHEWAGDSASDEVDASRMPVLILPAPVLFLILQGGWHEILMRTSWHQLGISLARRERLISLEERQAERLVEGWPPDNSNVWNLEGQHEPPPDALIDDLDDVKAVTSTERFEAALSLLRASARNILAHCDEED